VGEKRGCAGRKRRKGGKKGDYIHPMGIVYAQEKKEKKKNNGR